MAWTTPHTFTVSEVLTAELLNEQIRDNFNEFAVAKANSPHGYFVSDGVNAVKEYSFRQNDNYRDITTTSQTYTSISNSGPSITNIDHSGSLFVLFGARMYKETNIGETNNAHTSVEITGQVVASDAWSVSHPGDRSDIARIVGYHLFTGLTSPCDARLMYRSRNGGIAHFAQRQIIVMPL